MTGYSSSGHGTGMITTKTSYKDFSRYQEYYCSRHRKLKFVVLSIVAITISIPLAVLCEPEWATAIFAILGLAFFIGLVSFLFSLRNDKPLNNWFYNFIAELIDSAHGDSESEESLAMVKLISKLGKGSGLSYFTAIGYALLQKD